MKPTKPTKPTKPILITLLLIASGCATGSRVEWQNNQNKTHAELLQAKTKCGVAQRQAFPETTGSILRGRESNRFFSDCMEGEGWTLERVPSPEAGK
jgi:hypothetical protein